MVEEEGPEPDGEAAEFQVVEQREPNGDERAERRLANEIVKPAKEQLGK